MEVPVKGALFLQQEVRKQRKTRRDKGTRFLTQRDIWVFRWITEMYTIRFDQLRQLLSRQPSQRNHRSPGPEGITDSAVIQVLRRWQEAPALVEYERIYRDMPGWIWLTPHCERLLDVTYARHNVRESRLVHKYCINQVRLDLEDRHPEYVWVSERALLAQMPRRERSDTLPHIPDGEVWLSPDRAIAVEVELSAKADRELDALLLELLGGQIPRYRGVWYFVSDSDPVYERAWRVVEQARDRLPDQLRSRMQIIPLAKVGVA